MWGSRGGGGEGGRREGEGGGRGRGREGVSELDVFKNPLHASATSQATPTPAKGQTQAARSEIAG